jgi:hypothetical protein
MEMEILISGVGPLPLSNTFKAPSDGDVIFYLSGSAWSQTAGGISIELLLDGKVIGKSVGFTNETASHKTLVPVFIPASLTYDMHTVEIQVAGNTTVTDLNDNFQVVLIY